jgi:hypothetical protein
VGELSVAYVPSFSKWLMLYHCTQPPGIHFRTSDTPWGFIHASWQVERCDSVHDQGRENVAGGVYGPYIIAPFISGDENQVTIYYLMSIWNPYQVLLMRSTLSLQR